MATDALCFIDALGLKRIDLLVTFVPSVRTVQAPHWEVSHPRRAPSGRAIWRNRERDDRRFTRADISA
jgi:hypothetical protein